MDTEDIRNTVRERYATVAAGEGSCCGARARDRAARVGYDAGALADAPEGANLGLGCGNPVAIASLRPGDTVLDLGAGAGFDCILAARKVGEGGKVIGVDMTPEMVDKARANAGKAGVGNVEFRLGHIESLPVDDNSVDVVISNCVINLSPDKEQVFRQVYRVLKPGGRLFISDLVLLEELPKVIRESAAAYCACVGGATLKSDYLAAMANAGLRELQVTGQAPYPSDLFDDENLMKEWLARDGGLTMEELKHARGSVVSVHVEGRKTSGPDLACRGGVC